MCEFPSSTANLFYSPEKPDMLVRSILTFTTLPENKDLNGDIHVHTEGVTGSIPVAPTIHLIVNAQKSHTHYEFPVRFNEPEGRR